MTTDEIEYINRYDVYLESNICTPGVYLVKLSNRHTCGVLTDLREFYEGWNLLLYAGEYRLVNGRQIKEKFSITNYEGDLDEVTVKVAKYVASTYCSYHDCYAERKEG